MSCKIFRTEIENRDWDAPLSVATREHLDGCAECRKVHDEGTGLRLLIGELEKVCAPADFEFRLRSRIAAAEKAGRPSSAWRPSLSSKFSPNAASLAVAAAFVLTSALALRFARPERVDAPDSRPAVVATATKIPEPRRDVNSEVADTRPRQATEETAAESAAQPESVANARRKIVAGRTRMGRGVLTPPETEAASASNMLVVTEAPVVSARAAVAIPLGDARPISLTLRNDRGESQQVSIKPVSFGTQELVGRSNNSARGSAPAKEGVW